MATQEVVAEPVKETQTKVEKTNEKKPNNRNQNDRKRENKPKGVQYVAKGEQGAETQEVVEGQEKQEGEQAQKPKKEKRQRDRPQYDWDKTKVTIDSKVPELPRKALEKPNKEEYFKHLDKIDDEIQKVRDQFTHFKEDLRKQQDEQKQGNQEKYQNIVKPLGQIIGEKIKLAQAKRLEFNTYREESNRFKDQIANLFEQGQQIRQKMKSLDNPDTIVRELAKLRDQLAYDKLTPNEEKKIISKISGLEKSIPFIEPLEKLERESEQLRIKHNAIKSVMNAAYNELKKLDDEIKAAKEDQDKFKEVTKDENFKKFQNPLLEAKKQDVDQKISDLKDRKDKIKKEYNESWDKYEDYEDLKRYHDWIVRQKDRVAKDLERKKRDEQRKARDEARAKREAAKLAKEQEELNKEEEVVVVENPFSYQIEICDLLINYCSKLQPTLHEKLQEQPKQDITAALKSDEWKKEKVTVMGQEESEEDLYKFSALTGGKKRKNQKKQEQQPQQQEKKLEVIPHDIQTIQFFDTIKCALPFKPEDLEKTIKSLQERKEYYAKANENPDQFQEEQPKEEVQQKKVEKKQKGVNADDFPTL